MAADPQATGRISRLRLGLALWFGVAFIVALAALDVGLLAWLDHEAGARLDAALHASARGIARNIEREALQEHKSLPDATAVVCRTEGSTRVRLRDTGLDAEPVYPTLACPRVPPG